MNISKLSYFLLAAPLCRSFHFQSSSPHRVFDFQTTRPFLRSQVTLSVQVNHKAQTDLNINDDKEEAWMKQGLLLSSFTDGLLGNCDAQIHLERGLIRVLFAQQQAYVEQLVEDSVKYSPCAGPNIQRLNELEFLDAALKQLDARSEGYSEDQLIPDNAKNTRNSPLLLLQAYLEKFSNEESTKSNGCDRAKLPLRFIYVPTAMYALNPDSTNTPGKQRQRARADAKSRRDSIIRLLQTLLPNIDIHVLTLDWDDGSIKQAQVYTGEGGMVAASKDALFPTTAHEAMTSWQPHLVYVQGGNTFWLHHCLSKTKEYQKELVDFCTKSNGGFYVGVSAGAIIVGATLETACWKGWDDPRVVPGMESYEDWNRVSGLKLVGPYSFFPHMEEQWDSLVQDKTSSLNGSILLCLRDDDACFVDGMEKSTRLMRVGESASSTV